MSTDLGGLTSNSDALVAMAVCGYVSTPALRPGHYTHYPDGKGVILPGMFGVTYNASVGDRAFGWAGDHVEPGVSIAHPDEKSDMALHYLSCVGNEATVMTGLAKGAKGTVTGEHARLLVAFPDDVNDLLNIGDQIQIEALGRGIALAEFPLVEFKKTSPRLLQALRLTRAGNGALKLPVAIELPIEIMGSGAELNSEYVDQDLMSGDRQLMADLGIDQMRLGDIIAIRHADHHFGRSYREGAVSIAICIHGDSIMTGHGPGIMTLMSCAEGGIEFEIDPTANISNYFRIGACQMTVTFNEADLVAVSVGGVIAHPGFPGLPAEPYRLAADGTPFLLPAWGGIVYNVSVGDRAFGWAADCIHPGVSIRGADDLKNRGLNVFACLGNMATVMTGQAQGAKGVVTGKSGRFSEQVIVHFPKEIRKKMAVGDQILVKSYGTGISIAGHEAINCKGLSPDLLKALPSKVEDGVLKFGVVATVPAFLVGAGAGLTSEGGSLHMQSTDKAALKEAGLDQLKLGDVVAIENTDSRYNHGYLRGAMSIGIVGQTDGPRSGYGPGMTVIMTAPKGELGAYPDAAANIASLLKLEA